MKCFGQVWRLPCHAQDSVAGLSVYVGIFWDGPVSKVGRDAAPCLSPRDPKCFRASAGQAELERASNDSRAKQVGKVFVERQYGIIDPHFVIVINDARFQVLHIIFSCLTHPRVPFASIVKVDTAWIDRVTNFVSNDGPQATNIIHIRQVDIEQWHLCDTKRDVDGII